MDFQLSLSVFNIPRLDLLSESDPFVVVSLQDAATQCWRELGRTETARDCATAGFSRLFSLPYSFHEVQRLRFDVYDEDAPGDPRLDVHDYVGSAVVHFGEVLTGGGSRRLSLKNATPSAKLQRATGVHGLGEVRVVAEVVKHAPPINVRLALRGRALDKKDLFGKSDPYVQISRESKGSWTVVHKTEIVMKNLNPDWKPFEIPLAQLCNGDRDRPLRFECFDWDAVGGHDLIGSFDVTVKQLATEWAMKQPIASFELINAGKRKKRSYKNSGYIEMVSFSEAVVPSFSDYLLGGLQMNVAFAIDFTASNEDPSLPVGLHHLEPGAAPNEYQQAIRAVGNVLAPYDSDQRFAAFGYGAVLHDTHKLSHCFPLNRSDEAPKLGGIEGVLAAYAQTLSCVTLSGPTHFAPVIRRAMKLCAPCTQEKQNFFGLLIVTDGGCVDMPETKRAIVAASRLPMFIVIVGVGRDSFDLMNELDSDDRLLTDDLGNRAEADIVQFVPFRNFTANRMSELAAHTLKEVPEQVTGFMKRRGILPKRPAPSVVSLPGLASPVALAAIVAPPQQSAGLCPPVAYAATVAQPLQSAGLCPPVAYAATAAPPQQSAGLCPPPPPVYASPYPGVHAWNPTIQQQQQQQQQYYYPSQPYAAAPYYVPSHPTIYPQQF